jgi:hypothetical protein
VSIDGPIARGSAEVQGFADHAARISAGGKDSRIEKGELVSTEPERVAPDQKEKQSDE